MAIFHGGGLKLFPMRNKIINGDFEIWQRGTSFSSAAHGTYHTDRFKYAKAGVMAHDITRSTDVPTFAQSGHRSSYSLKADCTLIDASIGSADYAILYQIVEGYTFKDLAERPFTLSFWVKATKTGTYCVALRSVAAVRSYVAEYTVDQSDTWEKKVIDVSASPNAAAWVYDNGGSLEVIWTLACGTDNDDGVDRTWSSSHELATSNQVNACDSEDNNFFLSQVQIEPGEEATGFFERLYQQELALCQRYYIRRTAASGKNIYLGVSNIQTATDAYLPVPLPVEMRIIPTTYVDDVANWFVYEAALNRNVTVLATYAPTSTPGLVTVHFTISGANIFENNMVYSGTDGWIAFDAEI